MNEITGAFAQDSQEWTAFWRRAEEAHLQTAIQARLEGSPSARLMAG
jgi:hypothetical protein